MHYFSSINLCRQSSAGLYSFKKSAPTLKLNLKSNEENIEVPQHTSALASSASIQLSSQKIKKISNISFSFKEHAELEQENLDYTEILTKLKNSKLIKFDQIEQKILSLIRQQKNYFLAKEGNIQKYFYKIEDILTNLWGDIAFATDGFKNLTAFTSIKLMDNEIEAWLDVKKFRNAAIKELLCSFDSDQLALILTNISLDQLTDLIVDAPSINLQLEQFNKPSHIDVDRAICEEIVKRLLNSLQEAKSILSHPGLQFLGKSNLPYWQTTLAVASLNPIHKLTKTAQILRMITQGHKESSPLSSAIYSLYEQLLTDLKKYQKRFHIQALQELNQTLLILQEYSSPPPALNQQILNCWRNLCARMAEHFHHTLINTNNTQDIVHSIYDLLLAYTELSNFLDIDASLGPLQNFIDHSINKLTPYQRNQLFNKLTSAPINGLRKTLSDALQLDDLNAFKKNNLTAKYLDKYPLQQAQIHQILKCLQIPFKSHNSLSHFPYQLFNYFFAPHPLTTNYLDAIRDIFKIEISISDKPEQKQNVFVRVLRGDVPTKTVEEIHQLLQKKNKKEHSANAWMKDCDINAQYITDASRGIIRDIAFNGKRVFNEFNKEEETEEESKKRLYIVASLLRNFWRSDKLTGIASAYISQTLFNLIDPILPINEVVTLPEGKAITALVSENCSMMCNVISPTKKNSARIEISFKRTDISQALTDGGPLPLKPKENYLRWGTTLEVVPEQKKNQDQNKSKVELVGKKISFAYSVEV